MQNTIQKITAKVRCDVLGCKNVAEYFVPSKGLRGKFFLCSDCLNKIRQAEKSAVPKSPQSKIHADRRRAEQSGSTQN